MATITEGAYYKITNILNRHVSISSKMRQISLDDSKINIDGDLKTINDCYVFLKPKKSVIIHLYNGSMPKDLNFFGNLNDFRIYGTGAVIRFGICMGAENTFPNNDNTDLYVINKGMKYHQQSFFYTPGGVGSSEENPYIEHKIYTFEEQTYNVTFSSWFEPTSNQEYAIHLRIDNVIYPLFLGIQNNELEINRINITLSGNDRPTWYPSEVWKQDTMYGGYYTYDTGTMTVLAPATSVKMPSCYIQDLSSNKIFSNYSFWPYPSLTALPSNTTFLLIAKLYEENNDLKLLSLNDFDKNIGILYSPIIRSNEVLYKFIIFYVVDYIIIVFGGINYVVGDELSLHLEHYNTLFIQVSEIDQNGAITAITFTDGQYEQDSSTGPIPVSGIGGSGTGALFIVMMKEE